jgi:superfamily I DNA and/or RNA helicase
MACLIPLKFNPNAVVLVGDPKQLPVMTFTKDAERCKADRSLFERLQENGWPVHLLRYQYRMHESIASFPSRMFYDNLLVTSDCVRNRGPAAWHHHHAFPPYLFWNVGQGTMKRGNRGGYSNQIEANFLCALLKSFRAIMRGIRGISIGVISFYNDQVSLIENSLINNNKSLMSWMRTNNITLQISTVDGFQGSEKDIIILSCVRSKWHREESSNEIGFLKDVRRVNVALTRAKHSLWILGNSDVLHTDELWNSLLTDAFNRDLIAQSSQLVDFVHEDEDYSQRNHNKRQRPNKSGPSKKKKKKWKKIIHHQNTHYNEKTKEASKSNLQE